MTRFVHHRKCSQGDIAVFRERLSGIIKSLPEMTYQRSFEDAWAHICDETESLELWDELTVRDASGRLVAFAVLVDDDDPHVGPLLGVQWCWAAPEAPRWAIPKIHRMAREVARKGAYQIMAYTHRVSWGVYSIKYVKV